MRQETIVKTYLLFSELDEKQKEKAIEKLWDINVDCDFWFECQNEEFKLKLERLGFYKIETYLSGFHSQGDGASFSAKHSRGDIETVGNYSNSSSMRCDNETILKVAKRLADKFYSQLYKDYNYLTSREAIIETIEANEYEFDQEGV